uniref:Uncharacterized protein n=1 Tax=Strigamia maritima TaxID=126957 RepID=T1J2I4_STRMM
MAMSLWAPETEKKSICRLTDHQQLINDVKFSPDTRLFANSLLLFEDNVQAVHQISWSADSRLLVSGNADSTLKVWDITVKNLSLDLPGPADEVYAVDWNPDGQSSEQ